jgi:Ca-activated chloride channel family protein
MLRTRLLLGSALALSLLAVLATVTRPRPVVAPRGTTVLARQGSLAVVLAPSHTAVPTGGGELFAELTVTLEGEALPTSAPISLALVLDTSGSMSGQKMDHARRAAHRLVDLLGPEDELAIVAFGTELTVLERRALDAERKAHFHRAIDALAAAGSTNISGGLEAG